jgi:3-oxoacyl-[acyl-carrier protein] reductase
MKQFKDLRCWITGSSRGIGLAIAKRFINEVGTVILSSKSQQSLEAVRKEFASNRNVLLFPCDVSDARSVATVTQKIHNIIGGIDILINNAGVCKFSSFLNATEEEFDWMHNVNTKGVFLCIKSVLPKMLESKFGIIATINSVAANTVYNDCSIYSSSKAGALMLSRTLRQEVRRSGIKVIDFLLGATNTEIWHPKVREKYNLKMMKPEDVADMIFEAISLSLNERLLIEEIILRPTEGDLG